MKEEETKKAPNCDTKTLGETKKTKRERGRERERDREIRKRWLTGTDDD